MTTQHFDKFFKGLGISDAFSLINMIPLRMLDINPKQLSTQMVNFNPTELISIRKRLSTGVYKQAGIIRNYNFTKDEWILNEDTVTYSSFENILPALEYDFEQEKNFSYKDLLFDESIKHLCRFTSNI